MTPCISQVTTLEHPLRGGPPAYARGGWSAVELWLTKLETFLEGHSIAEARRPSSTENGLSPSGPRAGGLLLSRGLEREAHWELFRRRLELLARPGGADPGRRRRPRREPRPRPTTTPGAADVAGRGGRAGRAAASGSPWSSRRRPSFCASLDTALALVAQCGAADVGVCLDLFHYYTGPSKFEDLALPHAREPRLGPGLRPQRHAPRAGRRLRPDPARRRRFRDRADPRPPGGDRLRRGRVAGGAQPAALGRSRPTGVADAALPGDVAAAGGPSAAASSAVREGPERVRSRPRSGPRRPSTARSRTSAGGSTPSWPRWSPSAWLGIRPAPRRRPERRPAGHGSAPGGPGRPGRRPDPADRPRRRRPADDDRGHAGRRPRLVRLAPDLSPGGPDRRNVRRVEVVRYRPSPTTAAGASDRPRRRARPERPGRPGRPPPPRRRLAPPDRQPAPGGAWPRRSIERDRDRSV